MNSDKYIHSEVEDDIFILIGKKTNYLSPRKIQKNTQLLFHHLM